MGEHEMFRTTLMGGFDKDDVMEQFREMKDSAASEKSRLMKEIAEKEAANQELMKCLDAKDAQKEKLERDITEKYQKYIDHYESISRLLVDSQIKADNVIEDARIKGERILRVASEEAKRRVDAVQTEVDEKLAEGKRKYIAVQEEMNEIVELVNQTQKRFMASYKEVHQIISTMPESLRELEDDAVESEDEVILPPVNITQMGLEEESFDEEDDILEDDISHLLQKYEEE